MKKYLVFGLMLGLVSPLVMFAQTDITTVPPVVIVPPVVVVYDGVCASNAVIAHENSQQTIIETKQVSTKAAIITRRDALSAAYLLTDEIVRNTAIKTAHDAFLNAQKIANKIAIDASKTENDTFKLAMKVCGAKLPLIINQINDQIDNQNNLNQNQQDNNQNKNLSRTLRKGMSGEDVKLIQRILGLIDDGVFGPMTANKVKEWQAEKGLKEDGILGKESIGEMETEIENEDSNDNNSQDNISGDTNNSDSNKESESDN